MQGWQDDKSFLPRGIYLCHSSTWAKRMASTQVQNKGGGVSELLVRGKRTRNILCMSGLCWQFINKTSSQSVFLGYPVSVHAPCDYQVLEEATSRRRSDIIHHLENKSLLMEVLMDGMGCLHRRCLRIICNQHFPIWHFTGTVCWTTVSITGPAVREERAAIQCTWTVTVWERLSWRKPLLRT